MADQADVMDALQAMAGAACFPNGYDHPSVTGRKVAIGQGWPLSTDVDAAIAANETMVSVYSVPSTTAAVDTPFDWNPGVVSGPNPGIAVTETDTGFTITGTPTAGAYVTAIVNGAIFGVTAGVNDTAATLAAGLASAILAGGISAGANGPTVALYDHRTLVVRVGAPARVGQITHRQAQNFQITVWAPSPSDRTVVASAIDVALKRDPTIIMPDTSTALCFGAGSNLDDKREQTSGFHRALLYRVQWDTLAIYDAYEVTAVNVGLDAPRDSLSTAG